VQYDAGMIADRIPQIQQALRDSELDGWLFAVFQLNDPISLDLLGLGGTHMVTRRCYYLIPAQGQPRKLVNRLEPAQLDALPGTTAAYTTWQEHRAAIEALVAGTTRLAAQYSPLNQIPTVSRLDAGTADLLRGAGIELVSSAELVQRFAATWTDEQLAGHRRACSALHEIVTAAFAKVSDALRGGGAIDEYAVQRFIVESFERRGLWAESAPIVGVNAHSADPHYQPTPDHSSPIRKGDFLLIDLWAKEKAPSSVYADITWVGSCAASPTDRQREIFNAVARGRDAAFDLIATRYPTTAVRGYEVDRAARQSIEAAGYGKQFFHRTGHSIGITDHGQGANMDDLETHDERRLQAMTGFSIEPGIYFPGDFGVRSEINVALTPERAEITGAEPQRELLALLR
jgi:Xaa-Pro aminopeptidase